MAGAEAERFDVLHCTRKVGSRRGAERAPQGSSRTRCRTEGDACAARAEAGVRAWKKLMAYDAQGLFESLLESLFRRGRG